MIKHIQAWKWFISLAILTILVMSAPISAAQDTADLHAADPQGDLEYIEDEIEIIGDYLSGHYDHSEYVDWSKSEMIDDILSEANLWHFAGHGYITNQSKSEIYQEPALIAGDGGTIWEDDIPSVNQMKFAFANACWFQRFSIYSSLIDGFGAHDEGEGVEAYIGWSDPVDDYEAYQMAETFYRYATGEYYDTWYTYCPYCGSYDEDCVPIYTIEEAHETAEYEIDPDTHSGITGDEDLKIVEDNSCGKEGEWQYCPMCGGPYGHCHCNGIQSYHEEDNLYPNEKEMENEHYWRGCDHYHCEDDGRGTTIIRPNAVEGSEKICESEVVNRAKNTIKEYECECAELPSEIENTEPNVEKTTRFGEEVWKIHWNQEYKGISVDGHLRVSLSLSGELVTFFNRWQEVKDFNFTSESLISEEEAIEYANKWTTSEFSPEIVNARAKISENISSELSIETPIPNNEGTNSNDRELRPLWEIKNIDESGSWSEVQVDGQDGEILGWSQSRSISDELIDLLGENMEKEIDSTNEKTEEKNLENDFEQKEYIEYFDLSNSIGDERQPNYYSPLKEEYEERDPIRIDSNEEFADKAEEENWAGNGTKQDPYVITGYEINSDERGSTIYIGNVTDHFKISGCYLIGPSGNEGKPANLYWYNVTIHLHRVSNATIQDSFIYSGAQGGIYSYFTDRTTIANNTVLKNNSRPSISFFRSNDGLISENKLEEGISLSEANNFTLKNNSMEKDGVSIGGSSEETWTTHSIDISNTINGDPVYYLKDKDSGRVPENAGQVILANCTGVTVENQNISNASAGIRLGFSYDNIIKNNTAYENNLGIYLSYSYNNRIKKNTLSNNSEGIFQSFSDENEIMKNAISENRFGVGLYHSSENTISDNSVSEQDENGIYLFQESKRNSIINNTLSHNEDTGIFLEFSCSKNYLKWNEILGNSEWGIHVSRDSNHNMIYQNKIIGNQNQAYDEGNNDWDNGDPAKDGGGGNYWSDYEGDDRGDGIGDQPYEIHGNGNQDSYPWIEPDMVLKEPHFSVEITDSPFEVTDGEEVVVNYEIKNTGQIEDTQNIEFYVDDDLIETKEDIEIESGDRHSSTFTWIAEEPYGERELTVVSNDDDASVGVNVLEPKEYELTINIEGDGTVKVDGEGVEDGWTGIYEDGADVNLKAIPSDGWEFVEWDGTDEDGDSITITMEEEKEITAVFEEDETDMTLIGGIIAVIVITLAIVGYMMMKGGEEADTGLEEETTMEEEYGEEEEAEVDPLEEEETGEEDLFEEEL